jgi:hypothetical protein
MDTWRAMREALSTRGEAWQKAQAMSQARLAEQERAKGLRTGSALMVEKIRETPVQEQVADATRIEAREQVQRQPSWMEEEQERGDVSREVEKARRVAAARERRSRQ